MSDLPDLAADPGEENNVEEKSKEVVERLTEALTAWHRSMPPDRGAAID